MFGDAETDLDDGDYIGGRVVELGHVDCEMLELVLLRLFEHKLRSFPDRVDASEVAGGV